MGFYVGSAWKYLSCICLNSKECFKRKELSGGMELACLYLNGEGKKIIQYGSKKPVSRILRRLWFVILTFLFSILLQLNRLFLCIMSGYHRKGEITHVWSV